MDTTPHQVATAPSLQITPQRGVNPAILVLIAASILAVLVTVFFWLQTSSYQARAERAQNEALAHTGQINQLSSVVGELERYDKIASNLSGLYATQKQWGEALKVVEGRLYRNMKVTNLQVNEQGMVQIAGLTPSYGDYAKVYVSLTEPGTATYLTNVQVISVSRGEGAAEVSFAFQGRLTAAALEQAKSTL